MPGLGLFTMRHQFHPVVLNKAADVLVPTKELVSPSLSENNEVIESKMSHMDPVYIGEERVLE